MDYKRYGNKQCNLCNLHSGASESCVNDYNLLSSVDILVVLSYTPTGTANSLINHESINTMVKWIKTKYPDKSVGVTAITKCATIEKAKGADITTCTTNYLESLLRRIRPKVIFALGARSAAFFTKEKGLTNGVPIQTKYGKLVYSTDMSQFKETDFAENFNKDLYALFNEVKVCDPKNFNIEIAKTKKDLELMYSDLQKATMLFADIEGSTTPYRPKICGYKVMCNSFTYKDNHAYVIPLQSAVSHYDDKATLEYAIEITKSLYGMSIPKVFHNGKYDTLLLYIALECVMRNYKHDTMFMQYLYDERPPHGLKDLCDLNVPELKDYEKPLKEYIARHPECDPKKDGSYYYIPNKLLFPYNGLDTIALKKIFDIFAPKVFENKQWLYVYTQIMMKVNKVYMRMEDNGVLFNKEALMQYGQQLTSARIDAQKRVTSYLVSRGISANVNINSPEQIATALIQLKEVQPDDLRKNAAGKYSVDDKDITELVNKGSVFATLTNKIRKISKQKGTYVDGFLQKIDKANRVHGSFNITFTDTGRSSSTDPNMQNIPPKNRRFIIPSPGHILIERDFSQLELRLMACRTLDPVMLEIYKRNEDIHKITAASSLLVARETEILNNVIAEGNLDNIISYVMGFYNKLDKKFAKELRKKAKAPNFHFIYGGYFKSLCKRINTNIEKMIKELKIVWNESSPADKDLREKLEREMQDLRDSLITEDEAQLFENAFFSMYRKVKDYHHEVDDFVKTKGYVYSPFGRIKHLPEATLKGDDKSVRMKVVDACNAAKNFWIQSAGSDMKYLSLITLQAELDKRNMESRIISEVHDSIIAEVPYSEIFDYLDVSRDAMDNWDQHFDWIHCKIPTDIKICTTNLYEGVEINDYAKIEEYLKSAKIL